jgi:hypothetical protein
LRQRRYLGVAKTGFQAVLTATMVDAKRLLTLVAADPERERALRQALLAVRRASRTLLSALQWWLTPAPTWPLGIKSNTVQWAATIRRNCRHDRVGAMP